MQRYGISKRKKNADNSKDYPRLNFFFTWELDKTSTKLSKHCYWNEFFREKCLRIKENDRNFGQVFHLKSLGWINMYVNWKIYSLNLLSCFIVRRKILIEALMNNEKYRLLPKQPISQNNVTKFNNQCNKLLKLKSKKTKRTMSFRNCFYSLFISISSLLLDLHV